MTRGRCDWLLTVCMLVIVVTVEAVGAPVHTEGTVDVSAVDALVLRLMSMYDVPGAALALIKGGRIVLEKGYGFRDLETHAPVTKGTLFNVGSISKSFTALGIAQLVDQHKLDLDTPVITYLPELRLSDSQATQTLTLRQLLSTPAVFLPTSSGPGSSPLAGKTKCTRS